MRKRAALVVLFSTLAACGDESVTGGGGGAGGSGGSPGAGKTFSLTFEGVTVASGEEHTRCVVKRLGNTEAMHVNRIENTLGPGSHHLILYKSNDAEEQPEPFDCKPFTNLFKTDTGVPLMITQKPDDVLELPPRVGLPFAAGQMIRIEMHYINTTSSPIDIEATATFHVMDAADLDAEADFMMFSNTEVDIAPMSASTLGPQFIPLPSGFEASKFFAFTGHEHKFGTGVTVAASTGETGEDTAVYDPPEFAWNEPPVVYHDPPITVPSGGGFRFTCHWQNTSEDKLAFGESANDEMCLFYTYYYPSQGPLGCAYTAKIDGGKTFCCPGDSICSLIP